MSWLRIQDEGSVRWLTIDRPERRNAVPADGWGELRGAFEDFEASAARVLVVRGAGEDFCSGVDLDPSRIVELESAARRHERMKDVGEAATALHRTTKPTLAAVDGVAVGAGMNLAIGCDVVIATDRARFSEIFVKRGLTVDFGGSWLLPRIVGMQRAKELALSGRIVGAAEALSIGLVLEVVPPDDLERRAGELAESFLSAAPMAQGFVKQTFNVSFESSFSEAIGWEGHAQAVALGTEDAAEGVSSFVEKRDPDWKGR
ncbi:MAG: enoyl-CoA hydratase-related protein [Acidimicrobiia bacterium]|nr:enoyl-CoA hydratase-related protein [Acidimicrobiia bacterium]